MNQENKFMLGVVAGVLILSFSIMINYAWQQMQIKSLEKERIKLEIQLLKLENNVISHRL